MAEVTIDDPDMHAVKKADGQGRVYLGTDWKNRRVRVTVEAVDDGD